MYTKFKTYIFENISSEWMWDFCQYAETSINV